MRMMSLIQVFKCLMILGSGGAAKLCFAEEGIRPAIESAWMDARDSVLGPAEVLRRSQDGGALLPALIETQPAFGELVLTAWKRGPTGASGLYEREWISPLYDDRSWTTTNGFGEMQVPPQSTVVFRKHLHLDVAQQTKMRNARIHLSPIDDKGVIYVNGWKVGESGMYYESSEFSLNGLLRVGDNVITIVVTNGGTLGHMARDCRILP